MEGDLGDRCSGKKYSQFAFLVPFDVAAGDFFFHRRLVLFLAEPDGDERVVRACESNWGGAQYIMIMDLIFQMCVRACMWKCELIDFCGLTLSATQIASTATHRAYYKTQASSHSCDEVYLKRGVCLKHTKCAAQIRM
jgi:hypothetical protein